MLCLGIETSCDDTSVALVKDGKLILQKTASQVQLHALFGGVVPEVASREHHRMLGVLCDELFAESNYEVENLDVISVARGPGLLGSLLIGVAFAKALAFGTKARLVAVNHLHAHLYAYGLEQPLTFPALGLLVSGGHTHLYKMQSPTENKTLGKTLDDAAGEAFDKAGKLLGLPYPAGRFIDDLSEMAHADPTLFPRPYVHNQSLDFSFSGLKTAMATYVNKHPLPRITWDVKTALPHLTRAKSNMELKKVCSSYTLAVVETLIIKTKRALEQQTDCTAIVLAGGVAANSHLRSAIQKLAEEKGLLLHMPSKEFCTDNGAMIAFLGYLLAQKNIYHDLAFEAVPRGTMIPKDNLQRI